MEYLEIVAVKEHGAALGRSLKAFSLFCFILWRGMLNGLQKGVDKKKHVAVALGSLTHGQFHKRTQQRSAGHQQAEGL